MKADTSQVFSGLAIAWVKLFCHKHVLSTWESSGINGPVVLCIRMMTQAYIHHSQVLRLITLTPFVLDREDCQA